MKKLLVFAVFIFSLVLFASPTAHADVNDFRITSFDGDYTLTATDPQGELRIRERIDVVFTDNNHGILRAIPKKYGDNNLNISVQSATKADGASWEYTTYSENNNLVLKIGDADRTVTGAQSYVISYTVQNVITFYNDHGELYWDINGDQWSQPFDKVHATFHLPSGVTATNYRCYLGAYGEETQTCTSASVGSELEFSSTEPLAPRNTLTTVIGVPKGLFRGATTQDMIRDNSKNIVLFSIAPLIIGGLAFVRWLKQGRDIRGRGVIVPEYDTPNKLTPVEIGALTDYSVDGKDISATIIDLSVRKYIRIHQSEQKKLIGSKKTYSLELTNPDPKGLKNHEITILTGLFGTLQKGQVIEVKDLQNKFYKTIETVRKSVSEDLTNQGYFASNPRLAGKGMIVCGFILTFISFYLLSTALGFGLLVAGLLVLLFGRLMPKRSLLGVQTKDQIEGLKLYLKTAEAERLKMMQSPDSPYATKAAGPQKTVDLFEKLLPFAVLLGVEKQWAKEFEGIYKTPPEWYSGNWSTFNSSVFVSSLGNSVSAMGTNFSPPQSSSGSGFSGGGSSGGGGGGGGGGGW